MSYNFLLNNVYLPHIINMSERKKYTDYLLFK